MQGMLKPLTETPIHILYYNVQPWNLMLTNGNTADSAVVSSSVILLSQRHMITPYNTMQSLLVGPTRQLHFAQWGVWQQTHRKTTAINHLKAGLVWRNSFLSGNCWQKWSCIGQENFTDNYHGAPSTAQTHYGCLCYGHMNPFGTVFCRKLSSVCGHHVCQGGSQLARPHRLTLVHYICCHANSFKHCTHLRT